jgi:hypothetical protein
MNYVLYKNPVQLETLEIVQYLHSQRYVKAEPLCCIERNHPAWATKLPSIETVYGDRYVGLNECIAYYEKTYKEPDLKNKAHKFKLTNPDYRIH